MVSVTPTILALLQETPSLGSGQSLNLFDIWEAGGFMMWPLGFCLAVGMLIIIWKFFDLQIKAAKTRRFLGVRKPVRFLLVRGDVLQRAGNVVRRAVVGLDDAAGDTHG